MLDVLLYIFLKPCNKRERKVWQKKWLQDRERHSDMKLLKELRQNYPDDFKNYLRMDGNTFDKLLRLVGPHLRR